MLEKLHDRLLSGRQVELLKKVLEARRRNSDSTLDSTNILEALEKLYEAKTSRSKDQKARSPFIAVQSPSKPPSRSSSSGFTATRESNGRGSNGGVTPASQLAVAPVSIANSPTAPSRTSHGNTANTRVSS